MRTNAFAKENCATCYRRTGFRGVARMIPLALALSVFWVFPHSAFADGATWKNTTGTSTTWTTTSNWTVTTVTNSLGYPNGSSDFADFTSAMTSGTITLGANITLGGGTATNTGADLYFSPTTANISETIGGADGNTLTLSEAASHNYAIYVTGTNTSLTFNDTVQFSGTGLSDVTITSGNSLTFNGVTLTNSGGPDIADGGATVTFNGTYTGGSSSTALLSDGGAINWNVSNFTSSSTSTGMINLRGSNSVLNFETSLNAANGYTTGGITLGSSSNNYSESVYGTANNVMISAPIITATAGSSNVITLGANDTAATSGSPASVTFAGNYTPETTTARTTKFFAAANNTANFTGVISGDNSGSVYQAAGAGTVIFSGGTANSYNSSIGVEVGPTGGTGTTLELDKTAGLNALTGNVKVDSGATLLLGASNQTNNSGDTTNLTLAGGTFNAATFSDTLGTLTLNSSSTLTLGTGATLTFANSSAAAWTGTLTINGAIVSGSTLNFSSMTGLTSTQLTDISDSLYTGDTYGLNSSGYLVVNAVPEPFTWTLLGFGIIGLVAFHRWRKVLA